MPKNEAVPENYTGVVKNHTVGRGWGKMVENGRKMGEGGDSTFFDSTSHHSFF